MRFAFAGFSLLIASYTGVFAQETQRYRDPTLPDWAPFSSVVDVDGTLYLSGELGRNPETLELADGIAAQTKQTFANLARTLEQMDSGLADIVKCTVFLDTMDDYEAMNAAYQEVFEGLPLPARATVSVDALALGALVEVDCIAVRGAGG